MMTFDNEQELYKIMRLYPEAEYDLLFSSEFVVLNLKKCYVSRLVLRIAVSDPTAVCPLNLKFGCEPEEAAPSLLKLASAIGANVIGVRLA